MSKIEELIQQYCPKGVEFVPLGSVCEIGTGSHNTQDGMHEGRYTFYTRGSDVLYLNDFDYDETAIITAGDGAGVGKVFHFVNGKYALHQRAYRVVPDESKILARYVYHYFGATFYDYIMKSSVSSSVVSIRKPMMQNYPIPLPPLPVQEEIVRILDTFTELQVELQAELQVELQARQLQYQYYRDQLFTFDGRNDIKWKKLSEVADIKTGRRFVRTDIKESGVPCFHYGDLYTYYGITTTKTKGYLDAELASKLRFAQPNDVVVVCAGENDMDLGIGVAWLGDEPAVVHDACCILHHEQNPRYISHFLRTHKYHLQMKRYAKTGKISSLSSKSLGEAIIPIPTLEEQEKIANILDRFDYLVNDLFQGLPAEIKARKQQYEYYRDKLLTFKKKV